MWLFNILKKIKGVSMCGDCNQKLNMDYPEKYVNRNGDQVVFLGETGSRQKYSMVLVVIRKNDNTFRTYEVDEYGSYGGATHGCDLLLKNSHIQRTKEKIDVSNPSKYRLRRGGKPLYIAVDHEMPVDSVGKLLAIVENGEDTVTAVRYSWYGKAGISDYDLIPNTCERC